MEQPKYTCKECGIAVILIDGKIIRPCKHTDAGVIADMSATAYGRSKLEDQDGHSLHS